MQCNRKHKIYSISTILVYVLPEIIRENDSHWVPLFEFNIKSVVYCAVQFYHKTWKNSNTVRHLSFWMCRGSLRKKRVRKGDLERDKLGSIFSSIGFGEIFRLKNGHFDCWAHHRYQCDRFDNSQVLDNYFASCARKWVYSGFVSISPFIFMVFWDSSWSR